MKTVTKFLSMLLLVAMCMSLFGGNAYAAELPQAAAEGGALDVYSNGSSGNLPAAASDYSSGDALPASLDDNTSVTSLPGGDDAESATSFVKNETKTKFYDTLAAAVSDASSGDILVLVKSVMIESSLTVDKNLTIKTDKYTWTVKSLTLKNAAVLTVAQGEADFSSASITVSKGCKINLGGDLEVKGNPFKVSNSYIVAKKGCKFYDVTKSTIDSYVETGCEAKDMGEYREVVAREDVTDGVAYIGNTYYATLQEAFNAAASGATVYIKQSSADIALSEDVELTGKNLTLNLSGQEVELNSLTVNSGATLTITNGYLNGAVVVVGTLNVKGSDAYDKVNTVLASLGGTVNVSGNGAIEEIQMDNGTVNMTSGKIGSITVTGSSDKVAVSGGTVNYINENNESIDAPKSVTGGTWYTRNVKGYVKAGINCTENSDGSITVGTGSTPTPTPVTDSITVKQYTDSYKRGSSVSNLGFQVQVSGSTSLSDAINSMKINIQVENGTIYTLSPAATYYSANSSTGNVNIYTSTFSNSALKTSIDNAISTSGNASVCFYFLFDGVLYDGNTKYVKVYDNGSDPTDDYLVDYISGIDSWYSGDNKLGFRIQPGIASKGGIAVDGYKVPGEDYVDKGTGLIYLGTAYLGDLSTGWHTLTVYYNEMFQEPSRSIQFYVGPSLKAVDTNKHVINSSKDLKFVCSTTIDANNVRVGTGNGWLEEGNQFTISGNGRYITLKAKFLNARTAGETYTLYVKTTGGEWTSCNFQILTTAQAASSPRTGDNSNIGLWLVFMAVSGGAVAVALPKLKKGKD